MAYVFLYQDSLMKTIYILVLFYHIGSKDLIKKHLLDLLANKEEEREGKETTRLCKKLSNFSNIVFEK